MSAILLIPPSAEPWSVAEAKAFLRVEHDDDDAVIAALIAAARFHVEALSRRALLVQRWRFVLDAWPANGRLDPRMGPLRSVIAARVFDARATLTALIHNLRRSMPLPTSSPRHAARCRCRAALPPASSSTSSSATDRARTDVPDALRHAIRMLVAHWYENRGLIAVGQTVAMMPASVNAMIASYRVRALIVSAFSKDITKPRILRRAQWRGDVRSLALESAGALTFTAM